tara:strand:- start:25 stop:327 length:303 start_codon:yes stop_codon:yes gene_type:complete
MILYKNNEENSKLHNVLGFDYIIESETHFINLCVVSEIVDSICIQKKPQINKEYNREYEITLSECYEVIAFAADIRAVIGRKIYILEKEVYPYASNTTTL